MDLVSSIRKTGSRGGVNFNWDDVTTSAHRENYLGHSLKAPVGRWQKGRDLSWYTKADGTDSSSNETPEEKAARERKEELKAIKEAEEDALARALGLPVAPRNVTGANAVDVSQPRMAPQDGGAPEAEGSRSEENRPRASRHHEDSERRHRRRHRSRSRSRSRDPDRRRHHHRHHDYDKDRGRRRDKQRSHSREKDTHKPRKPHRVNRDRSRSLEGRRRAQRDDRRSRSRDQRRSKSPQRYRRRSLERD
ncbi:kinase phosphorylation protein-domain-containing protein [Xylaria flabelliformis]|nr:kinase phosphorylation protein-domain-containing protein [Xylaria flabelliformis]